MSLFDIIESFDRLAESSIEGMDSITLKFQTIYNKMKKKPYNILDHRKRDFEYDFADFKRQVTDLEVHVVVITCYIVFGNIKYNVLCLTVVKIIRFLTRK